MKVSDAIPVGSIPAGPGPSGATLSWYGTDNRENFKLWDGQGAYGERDISYRFNRQGYRCSEFSELADTRIVSIGCSCTFGIGLEQSELFHELFAERLRQAKGRSVANWNLAGPDKSTDYIARLLHLAVPILDPHIVLILFPPMDRRECMTADGRLLDFGLDLKRDPRSTHPVIAEMFERLTDLASPLDDELDFFRGYRSVSQLLRKRIWLFGFVHAPSECSVTTHLDPCRLAGELTELDLARDHIHPGRESHARLSEMFWERFLQACDADRDLSQNAV
jgi:hypothetical protein